MSFIPGKSATTKVTGKVDIYELTETGSKKKVGTLDVTCKRLPMPEYQSLVAAATEDADGGLERWVPALREVYTEIRGASREDGTPWTIEDGLLEAMANEAQHIMPLIDFMGRVHQGDLKRKN